ncbi:MAG: hypothetical protein ACREKH_01585, partial [Candidatus Rokuibacteriota bacterium]
KETALPHCFVTGLRSQTVVVKPPASAEAAVPTVGALSKILSPVHGIAVPVIGELVMSGSVVPSVGAAAWLAVVTLVSRP